MVYSIIINYLFTLAGGIMSELVLNAENIKKSFVTGEVTAEVLKGVDFSLDRKSVV